MTSRSPTLICVYNADGGLAQALVDMVHKIVRPASYPCSLCALTYGALAMRGEWKRTLERLGLPVLFLYRDEFREVLDTRDLPLPVVLLGGEAGPPEVLVSAAELGVLPDLAALIALVEARVAVSR
ncbi:hypothetical protein ACLBKU_13550 [Erythrobacter sp. NE805]|uniref:hypothetical protein n=1 Tax=Erythrobacter sp. NE805 TaxID=3389875 RepID=UPI00396AF4C5